MDSTCHKVPHVRREEGEEVQEQDGNCRYDTGRVENKVQSQTGWEKP